MSLTQSRGLADAGRWTAAATTLADHLEALGSAKEQSGSVPALPNGAIQAARRFFTFALNGIELDQNRGSMNLAATPRPSQAAAAGISNLSIAVKVIRSEKAKSKTADLMIVERKIKSLLDSLDHLQSRKEPLSATKRRSLALFLRELQRQGEIERDAAIALQEGPRIYRSSVR